MKLVRAIPFICLGLACSAFAAREAANEVGRWAGFEHSTADPGPPVVLDLIANTDVSRFALRGTISGLPAVQFPVAVTGFVNPAGRLHLTLLNRDSNTEIGFCDGSVRPVENFGRGSGQDDLGSLEFTLRNANGGTIRGHMNLLHMFGGTNWMSSGFNWAPIGGLPHREQATGAFMPGGADAATRCSFFGEQMGGETSSAFGGGMLLPAVQFQMVGTSNARGGLIMLCDGSVRNGDQNALIGLLFTGAIPADSTNALDVVGHAGIGAFTQLLPAVQRVREAAMSFHWAAGG